jgi:hypothetical protein
MNQPHYNWYGWLVLRLRKDADKHRYQTAWCYIIKCERTKWRRYFMATVLYFQGKDRRKPRISSITIVGGPADTQKGFRALDRLL